MTVISNKPIALLIPCHDTKNQNWFYVWEDTKENSISNVYNTREEALNNKPEGHITLDDGWHKI